MGFWHCVKYGIARLRGNRPLQMENKNDRNTHRNQQFRIVHMAGRDWNRYRYWYALYYLFVYLQKTPDAIVLAATWELAAPMNILRHLFPKSRYTVIAHGLEITKIEKTNAANNSGKPLNTHCLPVRSAGSLIMK